MVDFKGPGLDDWSSGSGFGSGSHDCPAGKHWDESLKTCVDDIQVGNKPDGHDYQIQKASTVSGLDFTTVYQDNNSIDANKDYDSAVASGGFWQMLVDGAMTKTNLPISDRYDATKKKLDEDALKHEYSCEYMLNGCESCEWSWFATATTLEEAIAKVKAAQEGTAYATISYGKYQIRDWTGAVVWSQVIDTPTPPVDPAVPPVDIENSMNALMVGIVVVLMIGLSAYMMQGSE